MYAVDRSVAVLKPKAPFLAWLNALPDNTIELSLSSLRSDGTVVLMPEFTEPEQGIAYLDEIYDQLFKMELYSWCEETSLWPSDLSLKAFWEWFDVEIHSSVIDSVDEKISNYPLTDIVPDSNDHD